MTVKRVIFIRPAETDWNRSERWQGWAAVPLNEHGKRQALRLANFVRNIGLSALYTSDLRRAMETAELLADKLGFAPVPDARLRERNIGAWQGLTMAEMQNWYPDEYKQLLADPEYFQVPGGGESRAEVKARMRAAFEDVLKQEKGETVGIISHTTAIHSLLMDIIPGGFSRNVSVSNTSVTTIAREGEAWKLVAADDVMHLQGLETQTYPDLEDTHHDSGD